MPEDKLTHAERIRLEALAQTIAYYAGRCPGLDAVMLNAEKIERWLYKASGNSDAY